MSGSWRVVIADDEPAARRGVRQMLARYPQFTVVRECRDGRETLEALDDADVVFLDLQMPEMNGFEVVRRRTPERMPSVVFLTAYDQFALRAFEAEALDYLVKPVSEARFDATMKRLVRRLRGGDGASESTIVVVSTPRGTIVIPLREIDWVEAADYYVRIWTGKRSYLLRESLSQLEARVGVQGFIRAHRRALVRVAAVRAITEGEDGESRAVLACGTEVPISRRRRATFAAALKGK